MKSYILIRHGEAEHQVRSITGGWSDTTLTPNGEIQVRLLAERLQIELAGLPVHLGTSNLRRAVQTAQIISETIGVPAHIYPEITDLNNGIAAGKTHEEAKQLVNPLTEPSVDWQPYPEAETWREFTLRVHKFMDAFHPTEYSTTIFISHAATLHAMINWWLDIPLESQTHFQVQPASLSVLTYNRWQECSLARLNDIAHLFEKGLQERSLFS